MKRAERVAVRLALFKERQARRVARKKAKAVKRAKPVRKAQNKAFYRKHFAERYKRAAVKRAAMRKRRRVVALLRIVRQSMGQW